MICAVLFDRDDTLCTTDPQVFDQAAAWAAQFGVPRATVARELHRHWHEAFSGWWHLRSLEEERAFWRGYAHGLAGRLGLSAAQGEALLSEFPYSRFLRPAARLREVLLELRARGLKVGVLSNTLPDIDSTLSALGIADLIDAALSSCALGVHKPDVRAFELAAEALGVSTREVLFIDDKAENVQAARAVGMQAELMDLRGQTQGALHQLEHVLERLA